ncbi:MAG: hypothetical protein D3920_06965 [Candidatus Electrothrix sp. AW2]|nr:hypothetical protein [Candidatus Electrothrix gigas]
MYIAYIMHIHKNTAIIFDADSILLLKRMQADTFFLINSYKLHLIKGGCIYPTTSVFKKKLKVPTISLQALDPLVNLTVFALPSFLFTTPVCGCVLLVYSSVFITTQQLFFKVLIIIKLH